MKNLGIGINILLVMTGCGAIKNESSIEKPNVIFILADDLGYGNLVK